MFFKHYFLIPILLFNATILLYGQNNYVVHDDISHKINNTKQLAVTMPDLAVHNFKKLREIALKEGYSEEAYSSTREIVLIYLTIKGENNLALEESVIAENMARKEKNYEKLVEILQIQAIVYYRLSLIDVGLKKTQEALTYTNKLPNNNAKFLLMSYLYGNISIYFDFKKNPHKHLIYIRKSIDEVNKISDTATFEMKKITRIAQLSNELGDLFLQNKQMDSAKFYYDATYKLFTGEDNHISSVKKIVFLYSLSNFYYETKDYRSAVNFAKTALNLPGENKSPDFKSAFYNILYKSYLEIRLIDSSQMYSNLYSHINDSLSHVKQSSVNSCYTKLSQDHESDYTKNLQNIFIIVSFILTSILLLVWYWIRVVRVQIHQKYQTLINKLSNQETSIEENEIKSVAASPPKNGMYIMDETVAILLKKLQKFEKSNKFIKKDLTLTTLAHDLDTNTRYISEIIKEHRGKNFNAYINTLRIQYITQKLYDDKRYRNYKIAYLADISGFSSREVFATIFKKETGVTPSYFINHLLKRDE